MLGLMDLGTGAAMLGTIVAGVALAVVVIRRYGAQKR